MDVVSGIDRHLDITFGLHVVDSSSLVSVHFRESFRHPYISFFHLLVNGFAVTNFRTFFEDHTLFLVVGGNGGRGGLKWRQLTHSQLINLQGPHFRSHSRAKTNDKSTNLRKNGIYW